MAIASGYADVARPSRNRIPRRLGIIDRLDSEALDVKLRSAGYDRRYWRIPDGDFLKMPERKKLIDELRTGDLERCAVWEFTNDDGQSPDTTVRPIRKLPVLNLDGRLVGTRVRLANGSKVWALIGNVDSDNPRSTQHFLTLSVFKGHHRFNLARYHDHDFGERGPRALVAFLGLTIDEVFPIAYDLNSYSAGDPAALIGTIEKEPRERLSRGELIALAV